MKRAEASKRPVRKLGAYRAKRRLGESGEPAGRPGPPKAAGPAQFVIQKHDATRLHYDFRLEMDGVLKSWAVPKGLPERPGDKVLAIEVEDHPIDYGSFEGIIPEGNYGAGTVMVWDRGAYLVEGDDPAAAYRKGKIHFALQGEKCSGEWTLVRMQGKAAAKQPWLLIKNHDAAARAAIKTRGRDRSVISRRTMEEIARHPGKTWKSNRSAGA